MEQNYDFSEYFTPNIIIYKLFGFWRPDEDMKFKKLYHCYTALCTCIWVTFLLSQITHIILNIQNVQEITAALNTTITFTVDLIKMLAIYKNMNLIKTLIKELNRPMFQVKFQRHFEIAQDTKRMNKLMFGSCLYLGVQTALFWALVPLLGQEKTTLARGWFPYDWTKSSNFIITYIFQTSVFVWNSFICVNLDTFTSTLLIQIGVQCDILCATLDSLDDFYTEDGVLYEIRLKDKLELRKDRERFSEEMTKNLVVCVQHHREIMW